jgi:hypothetical protein
MWGTNFEIGQVEKVLVAAVDTALSAENALIAARSFGLGGVMIGGIRNNPKKVKELIGLPEHYYGAVVGFPRAPKEVVVHYNQYNPKVELIQRLEEYEEISADYYNRRTTGVRKRWLDKTNVTISK